IRMNVIGSTTGTPQVLMNYAPVRRGPWRLKALVDEVGHPIASRLIFVRPRNCSLKSLWALLNSPLANGFAFSHLGKRDNVVSVIQKIPMPKTHDLAVLDSVVTTYFDAVNQCVEAAKVKLLLSHVDAEVFRLYDLSVKHESQLFALFADWKRVGVPFEQTRFLPEELGGKLHYADFVGYEADWSKTNRRRGKLIDKEIAGTLTDSERTELNGLQAYADYHLERVALRPTNVLTQLEDLVLSKAAHRKKGV
ncbi:MAG: hypothetical protein ABI614_28820, partial [Planctomycetota bacterium]